MNQNDRLILSSYMVKPPITLSSDCTCRLSGERSLPLGYLFLLLIQNIDCGYSLESPQRGGSNVVPTIYVLSKNNKNIKYFLLKIFIFYNFKKSLHIAWSCIRNERGDATLCFRLCICWRSISHKMLLCISL